jgi:hypothetical protein
MGKSLSGRFSLLVVASAGAIVGGISRYWLDMRYLWLLLCEEHVSGEFVLLKGYGTHLPKFLGRNKKWL